MSVQSNPVVRPNFDWRKALLGQLEALRKAQQQAFPASRESRIDRLKRLRAAILREEEALYQALYEDLHKSKEEVWLTETGFVLKEIDYFIRKLPALMKPARVRTNLLNLPSSSFILRQPRGVVLILAPWNYPFQLLFDPLAGAIAAGNAVVLKPSEYTPATEEVMRRIIEDHFSPEEILFVRGDGAEVVPAMMEHFRFDQVFFTGSTGVGKRIYEMAAKQLTPVTLELGGKSPCIVEADANLEVTAKRIVLTKFSNAGQMCVAPDYLLVHASVKDKLVAHLRQMIRRFFGADASADYMYGRIVNQRHFDRLIDLLNGANIVYGGQSDAEQKYIAPTLLDEVDAGHPLMQEEIFGPILPILTYTSFEEGINTVLRNPNPLACYVFSSDSAKQKRWIERIPFGGGCINNTGWHLTNPHLPFGGIGTSGMGNYHGKHSFETFSHPKSILKTPFWFDPAIKYPPFKGKLPLFKRILK